MKRIALSAERIALSGETSETAEERGQEVEVKGKKKGILLWERLSAAILRFERF